MKLYAMSISGNCHKVEQLLRMLGRTYERIDVAPVPVEERPSELRAANPLGKTPTLVLDDGRVLTESGAILVHLARGTEWFPEDAVLQDEILRWMFFEQNEHEPCLATARYWTTYSGRAAEMAPVLAFWRERGTRVLAAMDAHLARHAFFAAGRHTIADVALHPYTAACAEGGFDLAPFTNVRAWLERLRDQPRHLPFGPAS
ncbi:MAG: glutathione S-transferase family protein [Planctomycetota bacterium]